MNVIRPLSRAVPSRWIIRGEHLDGLGKKLAHQFPIPLGLRGSRQLDPFQPIQHLERVTMVVADHPEHRVAPISPSDTIPALG
jgi:hypothetical protein